MKHKCNICALEFDEDPGMEMFGLNSKDETVLYQVTCSKDKCVRLMVTMLERLGLA